MSKKLADRFRSWAPRLTIEEQKHLLEKGVTIKEIKRLRHRLPHSDTPVIRMLLVEFRARRKGFWGQCAVCKGEGFVPNPNPAVKTLYEGVNLFNEWEVTEPPHGAGWQLWDDPEGAPISPVFNSPESLAQWCVKKFKKPNDAKEWEKWIRKFRDSVPPEPRAPFRIQSDHFKVFPVNPKKPTKYVD